MVNVNKNVVAVSFNKVQEFLTHLVEDRNSSKETVSAYERDIKQFEEYLITINGRVDDLRESDIRTYLVEELKINRGLKADTIKRKANAIRQFCQYTNQYKAIKDIQYFIPKKQKNTAIAPTTLFKNEALQVLRIADGMNARNRAIIYLFMETGLRVFEIEHLNIEDMEFKREGLITVRNGKGNKERIIPFTPTARRIVKEYLEKRGGSTEGPLFLSNYNRRMSKRSLQRVVEKVNMEFNKGRKEEDIFNIHAHMFRHYHAKDLLDRGYQANEVQELLGHSSLQTTSIYTKPSMREIAAKMENERA